MNTEQDFMRDYWRQKQKEHRARLAAAGRCPLCKRRCEEATSHHRACLDEHNARRAARKAARQ